MTETKIMATAVIGTILAVTLKEQKSSMGVIMGLVCVLGVFFMGLPYIEKTLVYIKTLYSEYSGAAAYMKALFKVTGIATITTITSDICSDAGISSVATVVTLVGKVICICVIYPVISSFFQELMSILP